MNAKDAILFKINKKMSLLLLCENYNFTFFKILLFNRIENNNNKKIIFEIIQISVFYPFFVRF